MPKLSDIYGIDDCSLAHSISSDALNSSGAPDVHGPITQEAANSKDGAGTQPGDVVVTHSKNDGRAKSKSNH